MLSQSDIDQLTEIVRKLTPEQASSENGRRLAHRLVRNSYETWCRYRMKKLGRVPAQHHLLIIHAIQDLFSGKLGKKKLMIMTPPGAAKSSYTSKLLGPWFLNKDMFPTDLILSCSYSYTLAEGFCREARNTLEQETEVLGVGPSKSVCSAGDWRTDYRPVESGGQFCAGTTAGIAGHRAKLGLIDDPIGQEQGINLDFLEQLWVWYWNDFWPRLIPNESWQIIIANRRHELDLCGRLIAKEGEQWHIIRLPFFAEDNDPLGRPAAPLSLLDNKELTEKAVLDLKSEIIKTRLWPEWYSEETALSVLNLPNSQSKAGLWQQRPQLEQGNYFKKDSIVRYNLADLPKDLRIYVGSDFAVRSGQDADRFCFLPAGVDTNGRLWILPDWYWVRTDTGTAVEEMLSLAKRRNPICWWAGRENITGAIAPFLYKRMQETNTYIPIEELSEGKDKEAKAQSIKARMGAKMVMFPNVPGMDEAEHELMMFPAGANDDFVDALAKLGQGLAKMTPAQLTPHQKTLEEVLNPRLTCGWVQRSHRRNDRKTLFERTDA